MRLYSGIAKYGRKELLSVALADSLSIVPEGELAIVLHTHMPYVEGYGTWPFGEEWLWEAIATSYLPLLEVLETPGGEAVTLSLTPVLCDQLEAPGAIDRCITFLKEIRPESHRLDIEEFERVGDARAVQELERSAAVYARAAATLERMRSHRPFMLQLPAARARWCSAATHPILPLLCLDEAIELQLRTGIEAHRRRFGDWDGGLWLPECAHAPWLSESLGDAGVRRTCVELTRLFGRGDERHLRPLQTDEGPVLVPIDRATIDLVWGGHGYPANDAYRAHHRLTERDHRVWRTGGGPYDHDRAHEEVQKDAERFVEHVTQRVRAGGLCVFAIDTELLGHWWHEGPLWLQGVLAEAQRRGLPITVLDDDAVSRHRPVRAPQLPVTSWGEGGDLRTWSDGSVADLAWQARSAELRTFAGGNSPSERARRELLALQSSDWAFLAHRGWAGDYPRQRAAGHAAALERALSGELDEPRLRNLAPQLA